VCSILTSLCLLAHSSSCQLVISIEEVLIKSKVRQKPKVHTGFIAKQLVITLEKEWGNRDSKWKPLLKSLGRKGSKDGSWKRK
jgi:hypothetical protein